MSTRWALVILMKRGITSYISIWLVPEYLRNSHSHFSLIRYSSSTRAEYSSAHTPNALFQEFNLFYLLILILNYPFQSSLDRASSTGDNRLAALLRPLRHHVRDASARRRPQLALLTETAGASGLECSFELDGD